MTEENEPEEVDPRIWPASPIGEEVEKHYVELELCKKLKPNESFGILKPGFNLRLLRDLCEDMSTTKVPYVVFEHDEAFEVRRLAEGRSARRFYAYVGKPGEASPIDTLTVENDAEQITLAAIVGLLQLPVEDVLTYEAKYSQDWKDDKVFSASMVSRRTSNLAIFRNHPLKSSEALKKTLTALVESGNIAEVLPSIAETAYETTAKLYRLLKGN